MWATATNAERIADTIMWYPNNYPLPHAVSLDTAAVAACDIMQALLRPRPHMMELLCPESMHDALLRLADIFKSSILHEQQHTASTDIPVNNFESSLLPLPITMPTESLSPPLPRVVPTHNPIAHPPPVPLLVPTLDPSVAPQLVLRVDFPHYSTTSTAYISTSYYKSKQT